MNAHRHLSTSLFSVFSQTQSRSPFSQNELISQSCRPLYLITFYFYCSNKVLFPGSSSLSTYIFRSLRKAIFLLETKKKPYFFPPIPFGSYLRVIPHARAGRCVCREPSRGLTTSRNGSMDSIGIKTAEVICYGPWLTTSVSALYVPNVRYVQTQAAVGVGETEKQMSSLCEEYPTEADSST